MNKLTVGLILAAVGLVVLARRDATRAAAGDSGKDGGSLDAGMVVRSPFTGDPGMAVHVPFNGDAGIIVSPEAPRAVPPVQQTEAQPEQ